MKQDSDHRGELAMQDTAHRPRVSDRDAEFDRNIRALAHAPTGEEFKARDYALLALLGVVVPAALLIWGWV